MIPFIITGMLCWLVPIWFTVQIYSVIIYRTLLFLLPVILIFIPLFLWLIENEYAGKKDVDVNSLKNA